MACGRAARGDVAGLISALAAANYKRETIRKTRTALAQTIDFCKVDPNPVRDERVKLPKERKAHIPPPLAEHVERVAETVAPEYVLPLLVIDETGPRVSELETAEVGDLDEHRRAIRVRWTFEKNERYRHRVPRPRSESTTAALGSTMRCRRSGEAVNGWTHLGSHTRKPALSRCRRQHRDSTGPHASHISGA
jgi:integrase